MKYNKLAITKPHDLIFGKAPYPVNTKRGLVIGGGLVYPELNFTLPEIQVIPENKKKIQTHYKNIVTSALQKARELYSDGVVLEFETLLEMTKDPEWGLELVSMMNDISEEYFSKYGLKSEIRLTPNDLREFEQPTLNRTSPFLDQMFELFERGAEAGGDLLSIESTGGKKISDNALMMCDLKQFLFSQAVLGVRDMQFLWGKIIAISDKTGAIPGGDTACAFGNTAMVLAEKKYIPKTFAAVARIITTVRTIVAIEQGAKGPDKDCGYEGPFLKAITGTPISMEGRTAACAHSSPIGNIAGACADLWSNESVQNVKLLAGMAPTVSMEQLLYDARLYNEATRKGRDFALAFQDILVQSDMRFDPQAVILAPVNVMAISRAMVESSNYIEAAVKGSLKGLEIIEESQKSGRLQLEEKEIPWIDMLRTSLQEIPVDESQFTESILPTIDTSEIILSEYGL